MKKFKKGDRVLVRNNDLEEWRAVIYNKIDKSYTRPFLDMNGHVWSQCRHIDDFRTGDKVQVRDGVTDEWENAVYGCYEFGGDHVHCVLIEGGGPEHEPFIQCRWHPSMPWADKKEQKEEPLSLEEKVDKMWEQFKTSKP